MICVHCGHTTEQHRSGDCRGDDGNCECSRDFFRPAITAAEKAQFSVRVVDHNARMTRYLCVAALLPPGIGSGDQPVWCVSFPLLNQSSYLVSEGASLHPGYVAGHWKCSEGDADGMTDAIVKAVPNTRRA